MIRQIRAISLHSAYASRFWSQSRLKRKKKNFKKLRLPIQHKTRISSGHQQLSQNIAKHPLLVSQHWSLQTHSSSNKNQLQTSMASSYPSKLGAQVMCLSKVLIGHLPTVASTTIRLILPSTSNNTKPLQLRSLIPKLSPATLHLPITCICRLQMDPLHQLPSPQT